jgi:hypothetical protein
MCTLQASQSQNQQPLRHGSPDLSVSSPVTDAPSVDPSEQDSSKATGDTFSTLVYYLAATGWLTVAAWIPIVLVGVTTEKMPRMCFLRPRALPSY